MSTPHTASEPTPPEPQPQPQGLGFDPEALRERYRAERDRRIRPDGRRQYRRTTGEFGHFDEDPHAGPAVAREPLDDHVDVIVIGGGFGGLLAGARLRQAGLEGIRIIEKGADVGGTWYWNRYPGIHCDIESYVYMPLLEEVGYVPKWKYAPGAEIRAHARAVAEHFDLYRDACFRTQVTELRWDGTTDRWLVGTDRGDRMSARHVVVATGLLSQSKLPGIEGIQSFKGRMFHTSRWDYDYTGGDATGGLVGLADKRVALVGTGATAIQVVPHLGRDAEHLYVFQRTPSSVDVRGQRPTDQQWAASLTPGWQRRRRDNFLAVVTGGRVDEDLVADGWTSSARLFQKIIPSNNYADLAPEEREHLEEIADFQKMNELRARVDTVVTDPATAEALKPWYRYMCKRPTFSDSYLETFNRSNVTLVDVSDHGGVERITEHAVVAGGVEYEVDCIVFGTGFEVGVSGLLSGRLPAYGRDGVALLDSWKAGPKTLHGFYSRGFPNLFMLGSTQSASSVNYVHVLDEQATHVAEVIAEAGRRGARCVEPTAEAEAAWVATIREKAADLHRFQSECTPGYYNGEGMPRARSEAYGDGPQAFYTLLGRWRADGGMDEVMVM